MKNTPRPALRLVHSADPDHVAEALSAAQSIKAGNLDLDTATKLDRTIRALVKAARRGVEVAS